MELSIYYSFHKIPHWHQSHKSLFSGHSLNLYFVKTHFNVINIIALVYRDVGFPFQVL
jgi:hypothetical protein